MYYLKLQKDYKYSWIWLVYICKWYIKRRTVANEAADNGRVSVNGKVVKPSYEVKVGDIVEIQFGDKVSKFEIIEIPKVQGRNMGELIKIL